MLELNSTPSLYVKAGERTYFQSCEMIANNNTYAVLNQGR